MLTTDQMKEVAIELSGVLEDEEKEYFGGAYSLLEKIKMNGAGSPKIIYESGIPVFDELNEYVENEISFVSLELLKNGLILRLNRTQRLRCAGIRLTDLAHIQLTGFRIEISSRRLGKKTKKIILRGALEIKGKDNQVAKFSVTSQNYPSLLKYFQKSAFAGKFTHTISPQAPEKDPGYQIWNR